MSRRRRPVAVDVGELARRIANETPRDAAPAVIAGTLYVAALRQFHDVVKRRAALEREAELIMAALVDAKEAERAGLDAVTQLARSYAAELARRRARRDAAERRREDYERRVALAREAGREWTIGEFVDVDPDDLW